MRGTGFADQKEKKNPEHNSQETQMLLWDFSSGLLLCFPSTSGSTLIAAIGSFMLPGCHEFKRMSVKLR